MKLQVQLADARTAFASGRYRETLDLLLPLVAPGVDSAVLVLAGETMERVGRPGDAADLFATAAASAGPQAHEHARRAAGLYFKAGDDEKAQLWALRLLRDHPDDPEVSFILVSLFLKSGEMDLVDALKNRLVASEDPEHLVLAAKLISHDGHNRNNLELYRKLRLHFPDDPYIRLAYLGYARSFCAFETVEREEAALRAAFAAGDRSLLQAEEPHNAVMWLEDEALLREAANLGAVTPFDEATRQARRRRQHDWGPRIRIGYVSADFWDDHATMRLLADVLRRHDRDRFEITLFCNTPERFAGFDGGGRSGWGTIVPIADLSDEQAEQAVRAAGIDILIDLKGHTGHNRSGLFNRMAAPVQVAWLGFPGTAIGIDCDYIIGDRHVLPAASAPFYYEAFCLLPETYQPNDPVTRPLPGPASRASLGLPQDAFIFASFNSARKLTPRTLDLWAGVLKQAPEAHFWVMAPEAEIRLALEQRGIARHRVHVAAKCAYEQHIARAQAADLALDTFPCNGHTTTSDMLWAGLPVVTARGHSFAARVSESLLNAVGLTELVAEDDEAFISLAAGLARSPNRVRELRRRLAQARFIAPLFDSERFCRHLEEAYRIMVERARSGQMPSPVAVAPLAARKVPFRR